MTSSTTPVVAHWRSAKRMPMILAAARAPMRSSNCGLLRGLPDRDRVNQHQFHHDPAQTDEDSVPTSEHQRCEEGIPSIRATGMASAR